MQTVNLQSDSLQEEVLSSFRDGVKDIKKS